MTKVTLHSLKNAGPKQTALASEAVAVLESIVNSDEFSSAVRSFEYSSTWIRRDDDTEEQTSIEELLTTILSGREWRSTPDHEVDLKILLRRNRREIGSVEYPGASEIRTSYWFINQCLENGDPLSLAAHWIHEWVHVAGYMHGRHQAADAAYGTGDIVSRLGSANKSKSDSVGGGLTYRVAIASLLGEPDTER